MAGSLATEALLQVSNKDIFQTIGKIFVDKKSAIGYGLLALITLGGQHLFSLVAFQCPCSHQNFTYGLVFLFAPAIVLLIIGYFLNSRTWKLFTGCCLDPKKMCPKGNPCYCFLVFLQLTLRAFIVPVMWISIALLNGNFYACAMSGWQNTEYTQFLCQNKSEECYKNLFKVTCDKASMPSTHSEEIVRLLQAQSQVIGWWLIIISTAMSLLSTCYGSCRSKVSSLQMTFWRIYIDKEKEKFDQLAQEYATQLAERNLRSFFENKEPAAFEMPNNKSWAEVSALYTFNRNHQYYSTLHRFVEHGEKGNGTQREKMMDFVDGEENMV
ncbi:calcium homeostasis modulator protein 5-like [Pelodytes ibericus]